MQDASSCNILFVGSADDNQLSVIFETAQRFGALTVSDIPHFAEHGGIIGLVMQNNKIRFEVNRTAAKQSHIVLSSELLKVASKVIDTTSREDHAAK